MTDAERSRIDAELQDSLSQASTKIDKVQKTFLATSTAGVDAQPAQHRAHSQGVIQILLQMLHHVGQRVKAKRKRRLDRVVSQLQTKSASRQLDVSAPVLWDDAFNHDDGAKIDEEPTFTEEELSELMQETEAMRESHESEVSEIIACQQKLAEIGDMMTEFTTHLALQSEVVADIQQNATESVQHIEQANDYLRRTVDNNSTFRMFMILFFFGTSLSLLAYEWVSA